MTEHVVSIIWGKSRNYIPQDVEELCRDGALTLTGGTLARADLLHFRYVGWSQAEEIPETIYDAASAAQPENAVSWRSAVIPGGAGERKDNTIKIDMGSAWSEREIVVPLQRTE